MSATVAMVETNKVNNAPVTCIAEIMGTKKKRTRKKNGKGMLDLVAHSLKY